MDFNKSIWENRQIKGAPFLVAHRGVCGANVPCNSITAFKTAINQGADIIELDVARAKDGGLFVFHPGMEHVFLKSKPISELTSGEVEELRLYNQDSVITSHRVPTLKEVFELLKDKVYINVDKYWTDIEGISNLIRECGVEKQVIVKSYVDDNCIDLLKKHASDLMFMPLYWAKDNATDRLLSEGINVIGAELLFNTEDCECLNDEYMSSMHERKMLLWGNSIVYNEADVISAYHTDDVSLGDDPQKGWGWLIDKGFDIIQTDWILMLKNYIAERKSSPI